MTPKMAFNFTKLFAAELVFDVCFIDTKCPLLWAIKKLQIKYCQTCVQWTTLGHKNSVSCLQVVVVQRSFLLTKFEMGPQNGGRYRHMGSISRTFYEQLLWAQIPKAQKDSQVKQLLALLGSAGIKAARKLTSRWNWPIVTILRWS